MKFLLILLVLTFGSDVNAQSLFETQAAQMPMVERPIYDLTKTREDIWKLCKNWSYVNEYDTLHFTGYFLGLTGGWRIVFDSTGKHCESDWDYWDWFDTTALPTIMSRLTNLYGKPTSEGGYLKKATWHHGESVIVLLHDYTTDQVSVHWRFASDPPLRMIYSRHDPEWSLDIETGRNTPPSIFDLAVTRQEMMQVCKNCSSFATSDTISLWNRIGGVVGRWSLVFRSGNLPREVTWSSHETRSTKPNARILPSKHLKREALKAVMTELTFLYGKPVIEEGPILKASWRRGEGVMLLTYLEQAGEVGIHWRYESDMPLTWIVPEYDKTIRIEVKSGAIQPVR